MTVSTHGVSTIIEAKVRRTLLQDAIKDGTNPAKVPLLRHLFDTHSLRIENCIGNTRNTLKHPAQAHHRTDSHIHLLVQLASREDQQSPAN